jgi:hypothetical protein
MTRPGNPTWTQGPLIRRVLVDSVDYDQGFALVSVPSVVGQTRIPLGVRRSNLDLPRVGETWLIERHLGSQWTFGAIVAPAVARPVITGSRTGASALTLSLLEALVALGLAEDGTTA